MRLSEPCAVTLLDDASLADLGGDTLPGTNGAIDVQPILRDGTYECAGSTLRVQTRNNGPKRAYRAVDVRARVTGSGVGRETPGPAGAGSSL